MKVHGRIALLAIGALALVLPASASAKTATKHHLEMYKVEQHLTLDEFDSATPTLGCPNGDIATDGMWRIDHVDQYNFQLADDDETPWAIYNAIEVSQAESTSLSTYKFKVTNKTSAEAQIKFWLTCLGDKTAPDTYQHNLSVRTPSWHTTSAAGGDGFIEADTETLGANWGCNDDEVVIAPSWRTVAGSAEIAKSYPFKHAGATFFHADEWQWGFWVKTGTQVEVGVRCLKLLTDDDPSGGKLHNHKIYAYLTDSPVQHFNRGNSQWEHKINCRHDQKGLVGGFDVYDAGHAWYWLGMDPRIKSRSYLTYGTGASGDYYLICFNDRTSSPRYHS